MYTLKQNVSLEKYNTFHLNAKTRYFLEIKSGDDLSQFCKDYSEVMNENEHIVLGGGSNFLFTSDFPGIIIHPVGKGIKKIREDNKSITLRVSAGEEWDSFVAYCVNKGYFGIENLSLIPGDVGASPVQNIGAYGVEVKDVIERVDFFDLRTKTNKMIPGSKCEFSYRNSLFKSQLKNQVIITSVDFKLLKQGRFCLEYGQVGDMVKSNALVPTLANVRQAIIRIRRSKLPDIEKTGNAGSFFKNPYIKKEKAFFIQKKYPDVVMFPGENDMVKIPAGWLIEKCGWKGRRFGDAGVHDKQALVLVNHGNANGREIYSLAKMILEDVKKKINVDLEMEVNVI
jgi:UDP-N-acetylmuramate dehydrogenase